MRNIAQKSTTRRMKTEEAYRIIAGKLEPHRQTYPDLHKEKSGIGLLRFGEKWQLTFQQNKGSEPAFSLALSFKCEVNQDFCATDVLKALYVYGRLSDHSARKVFSDHRHWNLRLFEVSEPVLSTSISDTDEAGFAAAAGWIDLTAQELLLKCRERMMNAIKEAEKLSRPQDIRDEALRQQVSRDLAKWYLAHTTGLDMKEETVLSEAEIARALESMSDDMGMKAKNLERNAWISSFREWTHQRGVRHDYVPNLKALVLHLDNKEDVFAIRDASVAQALKNRLENGEDREFARWQEETPGYATNAKTGLNRYIEFLCGVAIPSGAENPQAAEGLLAAPEYERNTILFGAPGTGKSYRLNEAVKQSFRAENCARVTFHPEYSYFDFVGCYKPTMKEKKVQYRFVPGPFAQILRRALHAEAAGDTESRFCLIVEEINRARVASVFGDIFQLLDRDGDGTSVYHVMPSAELSAYLQGKEEIEEQDIQPIRLPSNLYLWATMNSADQGVYPMDTAFKRRWHFEYLSVEESVPAKESEHYCELWNLVRQGINDRLLNLKINEDKLMGYFFLNAAERDDLVNFSRTKGQGKSFKDKVLMYLFEDAAKPIRSELFDDRIKTFSSLCREVNFGNPRLNVFKNEIFTPQDWEKLKPLLKQEAFAEPTSGDVQAETEMSSETDSDV